MTYISINPWSARSLDNRPVEISVTNLIFVTLFRKLNLTVMYVVYNFKWYRSFRSEVAQGWSYPIVQGFCRNLAGIAFWLWKINNNLICLQTLITIQENTVIHFQKYIYIYNCSFYFANLLLLYGSVSSLLFDIYSLPCLKIQASAARHNDDFLLNTLKTPWAIHSRRRYKICIRWVILRELESFRDYKGFSIIFPKILEAIWRFTRAIIFLIPLHLSLTFLDSKVLGFLFLQKIVYDLGSEIWKIKL